MEDSLVSLDGDGEDTVEKGSLHLGRVISGDVGVSSGSNGGVRFGGVFAGTIRSSVWVGGFRRCVVSFVPGKGLVLPTTIAAVTGSVTVNELLFGERVEGTVVDSPLGLEGTVG